MKRKKILLVVLMVLLAFSLASCAMFSNIPTKDEMAAWSPKKKAIYANGLYVKEWDSYVNKIAFAANTDPLVYMQMVASDDPAMHAQAAEIAKNANLTEAERNTLRAKKAALTEMETALDLYETVVDGGGVPSPALEGQLLRLIDRLEKWALAQ